ncbi:hypothetical protein [Mariprofundus ferrooxydans]|nr:hypothetical protein [Mariprofundus ferrooxydans]
MNPAAEDIVIVISCVVVGVIAANCLYVAFSLIFYRNDTEGEEQ